MLRDLIVRNRSYRRFTPVTVSRAELEELVDNVRLSPSAANRQPLKFVLSNEQELNAQIFATLGWAGYLPEWPGPVEAERPSAYIVVTEDKKIGAAAAGIDTGIAAQTILLGAVEKGLGCCTLANIKKDKLAQVLNLDEQYEIQLVIALGKPLERVQIEELPVDGSVKYWRDANAVHHVPKRQLQDIILK